MTAAVRSPEVDTRTVVIRPAPRREPPFDDEAPPSWIRPGPYDRRLPFEVPTKPVPWAPQPLRTRGLPDPGAWGRRLLIGMIETAAGQRPLHQLASLLSPAVSRGLGADFERAARDGAPHWLHRAGVRTVRAVEPTEGVAELCATVETGRRVRAIAMRLESRQGRWRCVRLQLG